MSNFLDMQFEPPDLSINADNQTEQVPDKKMTAPRRGRPKGARSANLAEVRQQAASEKKQLKLEFQREITRLENELRALTEKYQHEVTALTQEVELLRRRESSYQLALDNRLHEVADHIHAVLTNWGGAELEQAQVGKRKRGRPRKTLK